jgi:hypothetical protein
MQRYLHVYVFDSCNAYREYKRAHGGSLEEAPEARVSGTQGLDLGLYNEWKGSSHNLEAVFVGEVMRQPRVQGALQFALLRVLADVLDECQQSQQGSCYIVIRNL